MASPAKRTFTGTGKYQEKVKERDQVEGSHESKTFRTSAAPPKKGSSHAGTETLLSIHSISKVRGQKSEKDSFAQIAKLKALRDAEDPNEDLVQYERAGCSAERQKEIPKLDETNNIAYAYLRAHGNHWQYHPDQVHNKLKKRLYRRFDTFDKNTDNVMSIKEVLWWADRMKSVVGASDYEIEEVRGALRIFFEACGVDEHGLHRENWVEANQALAEAENERRKRGQESLVALLGNAYYDVLDVDNNGLVSMEELRTMMNVFHVPEDSAFAFFKHADVDGNGFLHREEMHKMFIKFWLTPYDAKYDGIYGYQY